MWPVPDQSDCRIAWNAKVPAFSVRWRCPGRIQNGVADAGYSQSCRQNAEGDRVQATVTGWLLPSTVLGGI